jgi:hypothetical protein
MVMTAWMPGYTQERQILAEEEAVKTFLLVPDDGVTSVLDFKVSMALELPAGMDDGGDNRYEDLTVSSWC